jgi:hypothetical protein
MNLSEITYEPSTDQILGVIGDKIHVKTYSYEVEKPVVLIMSIELFHKTWNNWIKGKRDYCERCKEYCGVDGYTTIEEGKVIKSKIYLNEFNDDDETITKVIPIVIEVTKFSDIHEFEHG